VRVVGPQTYQLTFDAKAFEVRCSLGTDKFSGFSTSKLPKLYVVSINRRPVYVGVTRRPIRARLRGGWRADGRTGYYGYAFRHKLVSAQLDIWCHENAAGPKLNLDLETVEAEVVYHIRQAGQWPLFQTEIHFRPSKAEHRRLAQHVLSHYRLRTR
jgi:hypothetical protein